MEKIDLIFRALRKDGNGWEESHNLLRDKFSTFFGVVPFFNEDNELCLDHYFEVIPETLGRYSGVKSKDYVKIFEGDIIRVDDYWDTYGFMAGEEREVYFLDGSFRLRPLDITKGKGHHMEHNFEYEIIGNIHVKTNKPNKI